MKRWAMMTMAAVALMAPSSRASLQVNLIVNGDAEAGPSSPAPPPGFTVVGGARALDYANGGGFPTASTPGPTDRGLNFFYGGNSAVSSLSQTIGLTAADGLVIDAGLASYDLRGYLGGFAGQNDNARLTADFRDSSDLSLGMATIGPVLNADRGGVTALILQETIGAVPIGTRSIDVTILFTRTAGTSNDGYADNLSLVLTGDVAPGVSTPEPATLVSAAVASLAGLGRYLRRRRSA